jgi:hypothetical protein
MGGGCDVFNLMVSQAPQATQLWTERPLA